MPEVCYLGLAICSQSSGSNDAASTLALPKPSPPRLISSLKRPTWLLQDRFNLSTMSRAISSGNISLTRNLEKSQNRQQMSHRDQTHEYAYLGNPRTSPRPFADRPCSQKIPHDSRPLTERSASSVSRQMLNVEAQREY